VIERITREMFGPVTQGHEARYCIAAGFLRPGNVVIDAACGIAYGASLLCTHGDVTYYGVDKDLSEVIDSTAEDIHLIEADLTVWTPSFEFDVVVGFETIEHLADYSVYLNWARRARRFALFSVPIGPTVGTNPFHLHDFQREDLIELFIGDDWHLFQYFDQPSELAGVYIFARKGITPLTS